MGAGARWRAPPPPLESRRGPRRQAWGAARERVYECGSRGSRAAGRTREALACLPAAPAPRRPARRARAHSRPTAPHTPDVHTHTRREASRRSGRARARAAARWGRGAGGGCGGGRGGEAAPGRWAGGAAGRRPSGWGQCLVLAPHPRQGTSGALFLSRRRKMSDCLAAPCVM